MHISQQLEGCRLSILRSSAQFTCKRESQVFGGRLWQTLVEVETSDRRARYFPPGHEASDSEALLGLLALYSEMLCRASDLKPVDPEPAVGLSGPWTGVRTF